MALTEADQVIANTMLEQLGGRGRLQAMVAAYGYSYDAEMHTLKFRFKGSPLANCLRITLEQDDLYTLEFWQVCGIEFTLVERFDQVYWDQMVELFEQTTGLYLGLGEVKMTAGPSSTEG